MATTNKQTRIEVFPIAGTKSWNWRIVAANGRTIREGREGGYPREARALEVAELIAQPLPVVVRP